MEDNKSFRVCAEINGTDVPLTRPIADKERAEFAYHMLDYMGMNKSVFSVDGKTVHDISSNICITEQADTRYKPQRMDWETDRKVNLYTVTALDSKNMKFVNFAPLTDDYAEANEMFNFIQFGLDPSVSVTYMDQGTTSDIIVNGRPGNMSMTDEFNRIVTERTERGWASEMRDNGPDFADAVANIPMSDAQIQENM